MKVDTTKVIAKLVQRIAELEYEIAVLSVLNEAPTILQIPVEETDVPDSSTTPDRS